MTDAATRLALSDTNPPSGCSCRPHNPDAPVPCPRHHALMHCKAAAYDRLVRAAASKAQEPVAWQARKKSHPAFGWTNWFDISVAEREYFAELISKGSNEVELRPLYAGDTKSDGGSSLEDLIREYARDLRRNSSGGDDYPWEWAKATADYLEVLIGRAQSPPPADAEIKLAPWRDELSEIIGHLGAAIVQSSDKDDQIIMDHVKAANEIAKIVRRKA